MSLRWSGALAWRLRRQLLEPVGTESVAGVVGRLGAVPAQDDATTELAIRSRRVRSRPGEVNRALAEGRIIKTFAFRGATHLLAADEGGAYLALRMASRQWELPSWQSHYGLKPADWPGFREVVREALADGPLTRGELGAAVTAHAKFSHLGFAFADQSWTLLKALAWHGDMSLGPSGDGRAMLQLLAGQPRWAGVPPLDEAGRWAVRHYLRSYGPATLENLNYWLGEGLSAGRKRIQTWLAELDPVSVEIEGTTAYVLGEDVDELTATRPSASVRLLPGFDQWVSGPGTSDPHVVPPKRRTLVTRKANLVVSGGVVAGTWSRTGDQIAVEWFPEAGPRPKAALAAEIDRILALLSVPPS